MIEDLKNKVVLITGASTGIGAAAAIAFGKNGAKVAVHYNKSKAEAEKVAAQVEKVGGKALLVRGDVTDSALCRQIVDKAVAGFGRIDVLINNAGGLVQRAPIETITDELFEQVVNLNVRSTMVCTGAAAQHMRKQGGGGAIINVTSVAARHGGGPGASLYAGSKGFVSTITHGLAKELVKDRIRVNAVAPGVIATPFHTCLKAKRVDTKGHEGKAKDHERGSEQKEKTRQSRKGIFDHGNLALLPMQVDF